MTNTIKKDTARMRAHDAYKANRKEAGRVIDIETCEIMNLYCSDFDPYGTFPLDEYPHDDLLEQLRDGASKCWLVRSEESEGWIVEADLPPEKRQAMHARLERSRALWEAACAAYPLLKQYDGKGAPPSLDEAIEWFKVNQPTVASEAERVIRWAIKDMREWARVQTEDMEMPF
jgi:hypothetical protein